ncbi:MAG: transglutaminase family protein, partial [Mycobacterium sp.]|nr:transglutaminase family protein [Mycobacterium sp.]
PDIGWIGFDPANGQCPTERYVRLAVGLDALEAAPVRGVRMGAAVERLEVSVAVNTSQSQSQQQA